MVQTSRATREAIGVRVISRRNSLRECLKVLRRKEILAFMMDQNVIRREGYFVDFFGKSACTTPGLAQLSGKTGAPIVPVIMWRESDTTHRIRVFPPIEATAGNDEESVKAKMLECKRFLEGIIREDPAWLEAEQAQFETNPAELARWWQTLDDPVLDSLITTALKQNNSIRIAGLRVLEAEANLHAFDRLDCHHRLGQSTVELAIPLSMGA